MDRLHDLYLRLIASHIDCGQWKRFICQIGIKASDLENFYKSNWSESLRELYIYILRKWREQRNIADPRKLLLDALRKIGSEDLATYVKTIGDADETLRKIFQTHYKTVEFLSLPWLINFHPLLRETFLLDISECVNFQDGTEKRRSIEIPHIFQPVRLSWKYRLRSTISKSGTFYRKNHIPRRILIDGNSCSGKTTLANKIAYDWALGKRYLSKYDLVCVLPMKYCFRGLIDTLSEICKSHEIDAETISKLLEENQEKVLIILDDFDDVDDTTKQMYLPLLQQMVLPNVTVIILSQSRHTNNNFPVMSEINWDKNIFINGLTRDMQESFIKMHSEISMNELITKTSKIYSDIEEFLRCPLYLLLMNAFLKENCSSIDNVTQFYKNLCYFIIKKGLGLDEEVDKIVNASPHVNDWQPFYVRQLQEISKIEFDSFTKGRKSVTTEDSLSNEDIFTVGFHFPMNKIPRGECLTHYKSIHESMQLYMVACFLQKSIVQLDEEIVQFIIANIQEWKVRKKLLFTFLIEVCGGLANFLELLSPFAYRLHPGYNENLFYMNFLSDITFESEVIQAFLRYLPPLWIIGNTQHYQEFYRSQKHKLLLSRGTEQGYISVVSWNLNYPISIPNTFRVHSLNLNLGKFIDFGVPIIADSQIKCHDLICKFLDDFSISNWNKFLCMKSCIRAENLSLQFDRQISPQLIPILHKELLEGKWKTIHIHRLSCFLFDSCNSKLIDFITDLVLHDKIEERLTLYFSKDLSEERGSTIPPFYLNRLFLTLGKSESLKEFHFSNWNTSLAPEMNLDQICPPTKKWQCLTVYGNVTIKMNEHIDPCFDIEALHIDDWTINIDANVHFIKNCINITKLECISDLFHHLFSSVANDWIGYQTIVELKLKFQQSTANNWNIRHLTKFSNLQSLCITIYDIMCPVGIADSVVSVLFSCQVKTLEIKVMNRKNSSFIKKIAKNYLNNLKNLNKKRSSFMSSSLSSSSDDQSVCCNFNLSKLFCFKVTLPYISEQQLKKLFLVIKNLFTIRGIAKFCVCEAKQCFYPLITNVFHPRDDFEVTHEIEGVRWNSVLVNEKEQYFGEKIQNMLSIVYKTDFSI